MSALELIKTVTNYAPVLGTALGGPLGGMIGALISSVFGGNQSDPKDLIEKINADPEAALKLKTLEYQHSQSLAQINAQNYLTEVDDRKDARKNSPEFRNFLRCMAYLVSLGFFGALFLLFFPQVQINADEKNLLAMLIGVLGSKWQTIIDFFYGSSNKIN